MKKLLLLFSAALTMLFVGCTQFDDTRIWDAIDELEDLFDDLDNRVEYLEEACEKMNTNIEALQTIVAALQANDTITSIAPIKQGDKIIGYTISFSKSEPITIYHGNDGKDGENGEDGYTPQIGIAKDSDNVYYWTLNGEWLLDENGNKIKAVGTDGKDGEDGEDGITPQLEIRDGYWYISYDNGQSWVELGKATGEDGKDGANGADGEDGKDGENGKDGDSLFQSVTWDEEYAYFTLSDGTVIKIPLSEGAVSEVLDVNINYFYIEFREGAADDIYAYLVALSDSFDIANEEFNSESGFIYNLCFYSNVKTNVLPNGTYNLSDINEANTVSGIERTLCMIVNNDEWSYHDGTEGVVTISDNKLDATFTLDNGEVHHVVYEGSLKLHEEDTTTPPANEIWYTTTDGEVVTPDATDVFGANIVSNTYENGKGVITFDGDVTTIGDYAFADCSSLASVTIPEGITEIGEDAFLYCESLVSINIPNSVTSIGKYAFAGCLSLASINIPDSVTSIGIFAFADCVSLVEFKGKFASEDGRCIVVDGELKAFASAGLTEYIIPEGVTSIGKSVFAYKRLASVTIPNSVTSIGKYAFEGCVDLLSITIPEGVTYIGDAAFYDCESLAEVYCKPTTPPSGYSAMFYHYNRNTHEEEPIGCTIFVPTESVEAYQTAPNWSDYAGYIVDYDFENGGDEEDTTTPPANEIWYTSTDGEIVTPADEFGVNIISNTYWNGVGIITFDGDVTTIGGWAFIERLSLASVTIPDSVTSIGDLAFAGCKSLASVTIPDSVTEIGQEAFTYCSSLASVTIPESVTSIGNWAFYNCLSLASVYCKATTPPSLGFDAFSDNASERKIYVPTESVEAYQTAPYWSAHAGYIEPYVFE